MPTRFRSPPSQRFSYINTPPHHQNLFSLTLSLPLSAPQIPTSLESTEPSGARPELANDSITNEWSTQPQEAAAAERNRWLVLRLYEALNARDVETVQRLLAPDIEWWFHGPPACQHMMRLLTGADQDAPFVFAPLSVEPVGPDTVLVEGSDRERSLFWVHAWTVAGDGVITQVREYFNTSVTVTRIGGGAAAPGSSRRQQAAAQHCLPVWESKLSGRAGKSLPGLVLAI